MLLSDDADSLPENQSNPRAQDSSVRALYVDTLNYHAYDMTELRRISENDPDLARQIVEANREATRLMDTSFRLGMIVTTALAAVLLACAAYIVVNIGWWQTIAFIGAMLGVSHVLRVVLTGEWSDTSWLGRVFGSPKDRE